MPDEPTPQDIAEARRANLLQQHANGKRLTAAERDEIQDLIAVPEVAEKGKRRRVTAGTISTTLGIPERTIYRILQTAGIAPSIENEGPCFRAIVEHYKTTADRVDNAREADRSRREKAEADEAELRVRKAAGELAFISDVITTHADFAAGVAQAIRNEPLISDAAKKRLGEQIARIKFVKPEPAE